jgi:F-type H+-transporting ATPase subunit b
VLLKLSVLLAQAAEGGEAGAEEVPKAKNPIIPTGKEMLWAFVFFMLLFLLLRYVFVPPLQRLMRERDEKVRADLDAAERAKDDVVETRAAYDAALAGARAQADEIIGAARAEADAYRAELQAQADAEIAQARAAAQAEISAARERALVAVRGEVGELAVSAASAVIGAPVDRSRAASAVERALQTNGRGHS